MQSKFWCLTWNNFPENYKEVLVNSNCNYGIFGIEVGESGTRHIQGYMEFATNQRLNKMKKINNEIHWETRKGTAEQAANYCKKENNYYEIGEISKPKQGKRNDLILIKNEIMEGREVDEITLENPMVFHQYGRTLNKIEDIYLRTKFRTEMTECHWYFGPTGSGKSHKAFENFDPKTHYLFKNDNGWWDGYTQQEIVIINDFRGEIPYNQLLQLIDKWPMNVKRRNREPMPFTTKKIIITSSLAPQAIYKHRMEEDNIEQLLRRTQVFKFGITSGMEVIEGNTDLDHPEYLNI